MNRLGTLALAGMLCGAATVWIFRRTANGTAILAAVNRIQAHLLEFWLFVDEPARDLEIVERPARPRTLACSALLLVPSLILSIPSLPLFFFLDALYGTSPLPVGKPAVVTLAVRRRSISALPDLRAPEGYPSRPRLCACRVSTR